MIQLSAIVALVLVLGMTAAQQVPQCGSCQDENDASCESETSYYNCFSGKKYGEVVQCKTGTVCTNGANICVESQQLTTAIVNVCGTGGTSVGCNVCTEGNKYTCVSRSQAGRCIDGKVTAVVNCGTDEICVVDAQNIKGSVCVPQCAAEYLAVNATCGSDEYTTTTQVPGTTPGKTERETACKDASAGITTLFFYTNYDSTCNTAVYCQRNSLTSNDWVTVFRTCPSSTPYFDTRKKECVATKPTSCTVSSS